MESFGPYDVTDIDIADLSEPQHSVVPTVRLFSPSLSIAVPKGSDIGQEVVTVSTEMSTTEHVTALHISVPATRFYNAHMLTVSVYAAPTYRDREDCDPRDATVFIWDEFSAALAAQQFELDGYDARVLEPDHVFHDCLPWSPVIVASNTEGHQLFALGHDGPRWSLRAVAHSKDFTDGCLHNIASMFDSIVVHRGNHAVYPGATLDMVLCDRDDVLTLWSGK